MTDVIRSRQQVTMSRSAALPRSERLMQLLQALRRHRRPVTGQALAEETGVSLRTLYRDIATLQAQGADKRARPGSAMCCVPVSCCRR